MDSLRNIGFKINGVKNKDAGGKRKVRGGKKTKIPQDFEIEEIAQLHIVQNWYFKNFFYPTNGKCLQMTTHFLAGKNSQILLISEGVIPELLGGELIEEKAKSIQNGENLLPFLYLHCSSPR